MTGEQPFDGFGARGIPAEQTMLSENPQIARLRRRDLGRGRCKLFLIGIGLAQKSFDLGHFKTG